MEFIVLWIITVIASFGLEIKNELRLFKDVADAGYKIDIKRFSELGKMLNPNASSVTKLSMLIPMFNIMQVFQRVIQYNNIRPMVLDQLNAIDVLEEMSEIEKEDYLQNPTGLNALIVPLKLEMRLSKAHSIEFNNDNEGSEIFYEIGESLNDITILKVNGPASMLTVEEQKKKVVEALKDLIKTTIEKYGDKENFFDALKNNNNIVLSDSAEDKSSEQNTDNNDILNNNESPTSLKQHNIKNAILKCELEKMREELIEYKNNEESESKGCLEESLLNVDNNENTNAQPTNESKRISLNKEDYEKLHKK